MMDMMSLRMGHHMCLVVCLPLGKESGSIFSSEENRIKEVPGESEKDLGDRRQSLKLSLCHRFTSGPPTPCSQRHCL